MAGLATGASAATIKWTINDALFQGGGELTGFFNWDSDLGEVTGVALQTTAGGGFPGTSYSDATSANEDANFIDFNNGGIKVRLLVTTANLATPAGSLSLNAGNGGFFECYQCSPFREGTGDAYLSGEIVQDSPAVPLPAAGWMLLAGVTGLRVLRRKTR